jgi:hypothetical protein
MHTWMPAGTLPSGHQEPGGGACPLVSMNNCCTEARRRGGSPKAQSSGRTHLLQESIQADTGRRKPQQRKSGRARSPTPTQFLPLPRHPSGHQLSCTRKPCDAGIIAITPFIKEKRV